jgi:FHA domain/von Willebrand factor type A domain
MFRLFAKCLFSSFLVFVGKNCFAQQPTQPVPSSIRASLEVDNDQAFLKWRFLSAQNPAPKGVEVTIGGAKLPDTNYSRSPYPWPGASTLVVILLDMTDQAREQQIAVDKLTLSAIASKAKPHDRLVVAPYSEAPEIHVEVDGNPGALAELIAQTPPRPGPANMSRALGEVVDWLSQAKAERRGIFVLTDGHSDDGLDASLLERARRAAIPIDVILSRSDRRADTAGLRKLALATGGEFVEPENRTAFVQSPFEFLDSGGMVSFPTQLVPRYFWQSAPVVRVVMPVGNKALKLEAPARGTVAGPRQTVAYLINDYPFALASAGIAALLLFCGLGAMIRKRPAQTNPGSESSETEEPIRQTVLAVLQNIENGIAYPILSPVTNIGRSKTNEIVLEDESVSRLHAILQQEGFGAFSIRNHSEQNGTFVNQQKVENAPLSDGDIITMGSTHLRFARSAHTKPHRSSDDIPL